MAIKNRQMKRDYIEYRKANTVEGDQRMNYTQWLEAQVTTLQAENARLLSHIAAIAETFDAIDFDQLKRDFIELDYNAEYIALTYTGLVPLWNAISEAQPDA